MITRDQLEMVNATDGIQLSKESKKETIKELATKKE
jgi:hypothetical protein